MAQIKYGDFDIDTQTVPATSLVALVQRGFNNILGNEVASKVTKWKDDYKDEHGENPNDAEVATYTYDCRKAALQRILDGTLGVRQSAGPRGTAIDTVMRQIAVERLAAALKKQNTKMPIKDETVTVGGKSYDRASLIAAHLMKNADVIRTEAEKRMAQADNAEELV